MVCPTHQSGVLQETKLAQTSVTYSSILCEFQVGDGGIFCCVGVDGQEKLAVVLLDLTGFVSILPWLSVLDVTNLIFVVSNASFSFIVPDRSFGLLGFFHDKFSAMQQ